MKTRRHTLAMGAVAALLLTAPLLGAQQQSAPDRPVAAEPIARVRTTTVGTGPNGATMRCKDGSYSTATATAATTACDDKGGVLVRFPLRHVPVAATAEQAATGAPSVRGPGARTIVPAPPADTTLPAGFIPFSQKRAATDTLRGPPVGATLLCTNGTYVVRDTTAARCATHGGVHLRLEPRRTP
jgi:hypothetical protein